MYKMLPIYKDYTYNKLESLFKSMISWKSKFVQDSSLYETVGRDKSRRSRFISTDCTCDASINVEIYKIDDYKVNNSCTGTSNSS